VNNRAGSEFDIALLERGREFAIRQNLLRSGDPLDARILNFINLLASGTVPADSAMTRSGISLELVNKLTELGRGVTTTPTLQPPRRDTPVTPAHRE
jgi:hypothetical protein